MTDAVARFSTLRLRGLPVPPDIAVLLRAAEADPAFANGPRDPLAVTGARLLLPDDPDPLLDEGYLTDADRADADVMANVRAMQETAAHLAPVATLEDGAVLAFWTDRDVPVLYILDTEGQYAVAEGATLAETLHDRLALDGDDDARAALHARYSALGIVLPQPDEDAIYAAMDAREATLDLTPAAFRAARYEALRAAS